MVSINIYSFIGEMNIVQKKILLVFVIVIFCLLSFFSGSIFGKGNDNKEIDRLSSIIRRNEQINTELQNTNRELSDRYSILFTENRNLQNRITKLGDEIIARDTEHKRQLEEIGGKFIEYSNSFEEISNGLGGTEKTLSGIIEGIEYIKRSIEKLPIN